MKRILDDPDYEKRTAAFVLTPTVVHTADGGFDLQAKLAVMIRQDNGWSYGGFVEWTPKSPEDFKAGVEVRFSR